MTEFSSHALQRRKRRLMGLPDWLRSLSWCHSFWVPAGSPTPDQGLLSYRATTRGDSPQRTYTTSPCVGSWPRARRFRNACLGRTAQLHRGFRSVFWSSTICPPKVLYPNGSSTQGLAATLQVRAEKLPSGLLSRGVD